MKTIASSTASTLLLLSSGVVMQHDGVASAFMSPKSSSYAPLSYQRTPLTHLPSPSFDAANSQQQSSTRLNLAELSGGISEAWNSYLDALEANPLLVKSITAGVILGAADLSGQAIQQARAPKNATTTTIGDDSSVDISFIFTLLPPTAGDDDDDDEMEWMMI